MKTKINKTQLKPSRIPQYPDKREKKLISEVYDKLYDLNSKSRYKYEDMVNDIEEDAKKSGHTFVLSKSDKWKLKKVKDQTYEEMSNEVPQTGDEVIVNSGRFVNSKGKVIDMGIYGNDYKVQMEDGTKAIISPTELKRVQK